ncbi:hypothetical protein KGQ20_43260, partial [Catenulispora sp. NF23]|uniref:hypothetical protein n=1 Tax=Catenulispora pinistramenti TaxID=2705254 RepID=UPI001BA8B0D3
PAPTHRVRGFLTSVVAGAALTAFISGCVAGRVMLIVVGLVLLPAYGLLYYLAVLPRLIREAPTGVPRTVTALAMIESLEAVGGADEAGDVAVRFELSVVPDEEPGFRVEFREYINLVALPRYQPRGIVVVRFPRDRPLKVRILTKPTSEWAERAATAALDSVPGSASKDVPSVSGSGCLLTLLGMVVGAGAILGLFHNQVFTSDKTAAASNPPASSSSTSDTTTTTTTTVTSDVGTVSLGAGQSMLDPGTLQTSVQSVTKDDAGRQALTVVVQDDQLTIVFLPSTVKVGGFDLDSLAYDRIPALVREAESTPGIGTPQRWQATATSLGGSVTIRIVVTGDKGAGTLAADGQGKVIQHSGG